MRKNLLLVLLGICFLLMFISGCSKNKVRVTTSQNTKIETEQEENNQNDNQMKDTTDNNDVDNALNENQSLDQAVVNEDSTYTWEEITVKVPESWKDKYVIQTSDDGFYLFQKSSYDITEGM